MGSYTTVSPNGAYTNANFNQPKYGITPGQPLLNIPKYTAGAAVNYDRPISGDMTLTGYVAESVIAPVGCGLFL